jgi:hypothetical protein
MSQPQSFQEDCVELLHEKRARGELDRRTVLELAAGLGVAATLPLRPTRAEAQAQEFLDTISS